ncbi:unnamed protein product [Symbiodinium sp. CCMP2456]|nr:unnamed protein product [Symbiodinium sp. CCMP2456]
MAWEQEMLDKWADFDQIEVGRLTKAAVELKALVHHQMHVIQEDTKRENSDLANAMLLGVDAIRFLMGADEVDEQDSEFNLIDDFDKRLDEIEKEADGLRALKYSCPNGRTWKHAFSVTLAFPSPRLLRKFFQVTSST